MNNKEETIIGTVEFKKYHKNDFLIASFLEEESNTLITVKGEFYRSPDQQTIKLKGYWEDDPHFGMQFRFNQSVPILSKSMKGITTFLSSKK